MNNFSFFFCNFIYIILWPLARCQLIPQFNNQSQFQNQYPPPFGPQQPFQQQFPQSPSNFMGGNIMNTRNQPCIYMGDMRQIDRRAEDGWWNLYPFGERYNDVDMSEKPWKDLQIDLDFYFPFYGFRYNYTFIYPEGFIAFNRPQFIQPPYTFPHPKWPDDPDPSFVAAFLTEQTFAHIGETKISHVWYRVVTTPMFRFRLPELHLQTSQSTLLSYPGRVEDPELLIQITRDIREGMVGARGFAAQFALIVTWERMGYGGQPKFLRLEQCRQFKKWLNTYQLVVATEEIRSYIILNYAHINYTSSVAAGGWSGRGGRQSALVGCNGGNGTGFWELAYSSQGDSYKLVQYGSTETAGRWLARVDEKPQYGGCSNASNGVVTFDTPYINMIGGTVFNVSGPCLRPTDYITMEIDEEIFDCGYVNMVKATCVVPFNGVFKTGFVTIQIAQDGRNYAWVSAMYMNFPALGTPGQVALVNSISDSTNIWQPDWNKYDVENLTIRWQAANISTLPNTLIDINLFGYWEDVIDREFVKIGSIANSIPNTGVYTFNPKMLVKNDMLADSWQKFWGGVIQVHVSDHQKRDRGDRLVWSKLVPFGWYFHDVWRREYGSDWALHLCIEWFDYDGRRDNFMVELETDFPCPCTLSQADADFGRFLPMPECDMYGDASCFYTKGAQHCVVAAAVTVRGATQVCCYDFSGWLMFSQDYEYNIDYLRYASPGVPFRAHPWGGYRYKKPPHVPSWSNFVNDLLPYDVCCRWAGKCEFYYWRRITSGCENYRPVALGSVYGHGHYITFDNTKYTFTGRGYYTLVAYQSPSHDLKVQIRTEQPPKTLYNTAVPATVITGVAMQDNGSSIVQVFARKEFRRWRYKTDLYVDGLRVYTDLSKKKLQHFNRVTVRSPHLNMNASELDFLFATGVGVKVMEMNGYLQIIVSLPPTYNETAMEEGRYAESYLSSSKCQNFYRTTGLLGPYNGDPRDDLTNPTCQTLTVRGQTEPDLRSIFYEFGERWKISAGSDLLFDRRQAPLYYPLGWALNFTPTFDPWQDYSNIEEESLIFNRHTEVASTCQNVFSCEYDFIVTGRREDGIDTLSTEKKFEGLKQRGQQKLISCGPLQKNDGVLKFPIGNNYLDGVTVSFSCKVEYFLHGAPQRICQNGSWSPGWWNWCRSRDEEYALKWLTGLLVTGGFVAAVSAFFYWLYKGRFDKRRLWGKVAPETQHSRRAKGDEDTEDEMSEKESSIRGVSLPAIAYKKNSLPQSVRSLGSSRALPKVRQTLSRIVRQISDITLPPPQSSIVAEPGAEQSALAAIDFRPPQPPRVHKTSVDDDLTSERAWSFSFFGRRPSDASTASGQAPAAKKSTSKVPGLATISEKVPPTRVAAGGETGRPLESRNFLTLPSAKKEPVYTQVNKPVAKAAPAAPKYTESSF